MASGIVLWYISWVHWTSTMQSMMGIYLPISDFIVMILSLSEYGNTIFSWHLINFVTRVKLLKILFFGVVFRYYCPYVHCWQTQIQMILSCQKLPTCTRLTGPNMRPPLVAGHRSTPWDDTEDNLCPFPKHFVTLVSLFSSFPFLFLIYWVK